MVLIFKPPWIEHANDGGKRHRIFSLHVHPDGTRLATGGMDSNVKIWDIDGLGDQENVRDDRLVSTVTYSTGAVMCIRWSPNSGKYLAAACDDGKVLIMEKDRTGLRGSFGDTNKEVFALKMSMTLGRADVTELAWSNEEQPQLAACTLDGFIFVYDSTFKLVTRFKAHEDFTKGLAWDPIGSYLASAADDRTVKIWRTDNWTECETIDKPFAGAPAVTMYRRLSWAPDGSYLAAPVAANTLFNVASIVSRKKWKSELSIAGHSAAIECAIFAPTIYEVKRQGRAGTRYVSVIALAGQDQSISITPSHSRTALFAVTGLFAKPVVDISWAPNGLDLFACSMDGSVAYIAFTEEELGRPLPQAELADILSNLGAAKHRKKAPLESFEQGTLEKGLENIAPEPQTDPVKTPAQPSAMNTIAAVKMPQTVTVDKISGKKRIQPTFLSTLDGSPVSSRIMNASANAIPLQPTLKVSDSKSTPVQLVLNQEALAKWLAFAGPAVRIPLKFHPKVQDLLWLNFKVDDDMTRWISVINHRTPQPHSAEIRLQSRKDSVFEDGAHRKSVLWEDKELFFPVTCVAASDKLVLVALSDNSVIAYSPFGRRLFPPLHAASGPVVCLAIGENHWMLVDGNGFVHIWELETLRLKFSTSLAPILQAAPEIDNSEDSQPTKRSRKLTERKITLESHEGVYSAHLEPDGTPIITNTTLQTFAYAFRMGLWVRTTLQDLASSFIEFVPSSDVASISGAFCNVRSLSRLDYSSVLLTPPPGDTLALGKALNFEKPVPLPGLSFGNFNFIKDSSDFKAASMPVFYSGLPRIKRLEAETRWLEWQIGAARVQRSKEAYKHYAFLYASKLVQLGPPAIGRAQEFLQEVSGEPLKQVLQDDSEAIIAHVKLLLSQSREFQSIFSRVNI